jgi:ABC-type phosphate/phosphonate transport system substrate-binding protein
MSEKALRVGAVSAGGHASAVREIWEGMRAYFAEAGAPILPVYYATYDEQVDALFNGAIDIAWNGPVAYVRCAQRQGDVRVLAMRDVDVAFTTNLIARRDSGISSIADLRGRRLALGDGGSRQGAILPLYYLRQAGLDPDRDLTVVHRAAGKTGDLAVLRALEAGEADAGMLGGPTWQEEQAGGRVREEVIACVWTSTPYSHCNFTALPDIDGDAAARWTAALLKMDYNDPRWRAVMDKEGLTSWQPGTALGYEDLTAALAYEDRIATHA